MTAYREFPRILGNRADASIVGLPTATAPAAPRGVMAWLRAAFAAMAARRLKEVALRTAYYRGPAAGVSSGCSTAPHVD
jgi:hypothetical protein